MRVSDLLTDKHFTSALLITPRNLYTSKSQKERKCSFLTEKLLTKVNLTIMYTDCIRNLFRTYSFLLLFPPRKTVTEIVLVHLSAFPCLVQEVGKFVQPLVSSRSSPDFKAPAANQLQSVTRWKYRQTIRQKKTRTTDCKKRAAEPTGKRLVDLKPACLVLMVHTTKCIEWLWNEPEFLLSYPNITSTH